MSFEDIGGEGWSRLILAQGFEARQFHFAKMTGVLWLVAPLSLLELRQPRSGAHPHRGEPTWPMHVEND